MGGQGFINMNMRMFDSKAGQLIMVTLLVMIASFYTGTLFGRSGNYPVDNDVPLESQLLFSNTSSTGK